MRDIYVTFYPDGTFTTDNAIDSEVRCRFGDTLNLHMHETEKVGKVVIDTSRLDQMHRPQPQPTRRARLKALFS